MTVTIDASVFVAAARLEEAHHSASREFLRRARSQDVIIACPILILPECAAAIVRPTGDSALGEELVALISGFPGLRLVVLDLPLISRAVQIATHHRLRGADSIYVAVAEASNATLVTWDGEMLGRGAGVVATMTPAQWMVEHEITK